MKFLVTFIILSVINVVFSTIRSIATIKSGKTIASLLSGGYFAFYNIMLIYTVAEFPMWEKCIITFVCNVVGVWIVKALEEKMAKDKLWKIEATIEANKYLPTTIRDTLKAEDISAYWVSCGKYNIFHVFCPTQDKSRKAKKILDTFEAKYFVTESKIL
jgi:uncharacterized protein YebE (UPF0316 family)